jgi:hypothetical protein
MITPGAGILIRLLATHPLEQNAECAVRRARYMTLETMATLGSDLGASAPERAD